MGTVSHIFNRGTRWKLHIARNISPLPTEQEFGSVLKPSGITGEEIFQDHSWTFYAIMDILCHLALTLCCWLL